MAVVVERLHTDNLHDREEADRADASLALLAGTVRYHVYDDGSGVATFIRGASDPLLFIPQIGAPHPDPVLAADGLVVINPRVVEWHTPNSCICEVEFAKVDPDDVWEFTSNRTTRRVPRFLQTYQLTKVDNGSGGFTNETTFVWEPEPFDEPTYEFGLVRVVEVSQFGPAEFNMIEPHLGEIHNFLGKDWLFVDGDARKVSASKWEIVYQWGRPAPLPAFGSGPGHPEVRDAGGFPVSATNILVPAFELPPFWDYVVFVSEEATDMPLINRQFNGRRNDFGYTALPGGPIP